MKKTLIAAGIAAAMVAPAAMADATLYGKVRISNLYGDEAAADAQNTHANRLGVSATEDLGNGLSAFAKLEWATGDETGSSATATSATSQRFAYVGIKGGFGEIRVGDDVSIAKSLMGGTALEDTASDKANILAADGGFENNQIAYTSPTINGFKFRIAQYRDNTSADGELGEGYGVSYTNGPLMVSLSKNAYDAAATGDETVLGMKYSMGDLTAHLKVERVKSGDNTVDSDNTYGEINYKMGANTLVLAYGDSDEIGTANDQDQTTLAVAHNFSKRTQVMAMYQKTDNSGSTADTDIYGFQINHDF
jgi:predicted porin